jgi:integrase
MGRTRFLSREELHSLLESCQESKNPNLHGMVLIAAIMGLRFGEIANLHWKNIDFIKKLVTLEMTKNGDIRVVPIPDQVRYLQAMPNPKLPEAFVFPSKNPAKRYPYSLIRKAFRKTLQKSGIQDFKYHD